MDTTYSNVLPYQSFRSESTSSLVKLARNFIEMLTNEPTLGIKKTQLLHSKFEDRDSYFNLCKLITVTHHTCTKFQLSFKTFTKGILWDFTIQEKFQIDGFSLVECRVLDEKSAKVLTYMEQVQMISILEICSESFFHRYIIENLLSDLNLQRLPQTPKRAAIEQEKNEFCSDCGDIWETYSTFSAKRRKSLSEFDDPRKCAVYVATKKDGPRTWIQAIFEGFSPAGNAILRSKPDAKYQLRTFFKGCKMSDYDSFEEEGHIQILPLSKCNSSEEDQIRTLLFELLDKVEKITVQPGVIQIEDDEIEILSVRRKRKNIDRDTHRKELLEKDSLRDVHPDELIEEDKKKMKRFLINNGMSLSRAYVSLVLLAEEQDQKYGKIIDELSDSDQLVNSQVPEKRTRRSRAASEPCLCDKDLANKSSFEEVIKSVDNKFRVIPISRDEVVRRVESNSLMIILDQKNRWRACVVLPRTKHSTNIHYNVLMYEETDLFMRSWSIINNAPHEDEDIESLKCALSQYCGRQRPGRQSLSGKTFPKHTHTLKCINFDYHALLLLPINGNSGFTFSSSESSESSEDF